MHQATPTVTIAEVVADLVAETLPRCTPALAQRLERAAVIALTPYAIHSAGDAVAVHCPEAWERAALARRPECTCPDPSPPWRPLQAQPGRGAAQPGHCRAQPPPARPRLRRA